MNPNSEKTNILAVFTGSMYDGLTDGYGYGTARGSYYGKAHTGNNWGHAVRFSLRPMVYYSNRKKQEDVVCSQNIPLSKYFKRDNPFPSLPFYFYIFFPVGT